MTNIQDIVKVVAMTDGEFEKFIKEQVEECNRLYNRYIRGGALLTMSTKPGHIHNAGHGTYTTDVDPKGYQAPWMKQSHLLQLYKQYRNPKSWSYKEIKDGIAYYGYLRGKVNTNHAYHWIEIATHDIDVSNCATPWQAIAKVRASFN